MRSCVLSGPILPCFYRETLPANAKRCAFRTNPPVFLSRNSARKCEAVCFQDQSSLFPSRTSPATMPNGVLSGPIFLVSIANIARNNAKRCAFRTNLPCFYREHRPQQCQTVCFQDQSSLFLSRTLPANAKRRALKTQRRTEPWARTRKNHHKTVDVLPNLH
jgi:hypothetical protein